MSATCSSDRGGESIFLSQEGGGEGETTALMYDHQLLSAHEQAHTNTHIKCSQGHLHCSSKCVFVVMLFYILNLH